MGAHTPRKTAHAPRQDLTDRLERCRTWREVMELPELEDADYLQATPVAPRLIEQMQSAPVVECRDPRAHEVVARILAKLAPLERVAVELIHLEGLSYRAAAKDMRRSHEYVRLLYLQAMESLRVLLTPEEPAG